MSVSVDQLNIILIYSLKKRVTFILCNNNFIYAYKYCNTTLFQFNIEKYTKSTILKCTFWSSQQNNPSSIMINFSIYLYLINILFLLIIINIKHIIKIR